MFIISNQILSANEVIRFKDFEIKTRANITQFTNFLVQKPAEDTSSLIDILHTITQENPTYLEQSQIQTKMDA